MGAIKSFLNSEKGLLGLALIIAATVLAAMTIVTPDAWLAYTKWIFGFYAGAKAVQGGAAVIAGALAPDPADTHAILDKYMPIIMAALAPTPRAAPATTNNTTTVIVPAPAAATETPTNA